MADRPRILLIPNLTELEWVVRPQLEEWADVASYDGPGVGDEPPLRGLRPHETAERGLAELDRLGWDRCVVVADELGALAGLLAARRRPDAVQALVLGHPVVRVAFGGERSSFNEGVARAHVQLADASFRPFLREQLRAWMGLHGQPVEAADALAESYLARVPADVVRASHAQLLEHAQRYEADVRDALAALQHVPKLLFEHEGCLLFTHEGFEDAAAAMPDAETAATPQKPSVDPAFSEIVREFVARTAG